MNVEIDELRREVDKLQKVRDHDHVMIVKIIDRLESEIRQLKTAVKVLGANDQIRNDAAVAVVDAHHAVVERLNRLQASVDLIFGTERTVQ